MIKKRFLIVAVGAFLIGCGWGFLIDSLMEFSVKSLIGESVGAIVIGMAAPIFTMSWWYDKGGRP